MNIRKIGEFLDIQIIRTKGNLTHNTEILEKLTKIPPGASNDIKIGIEIKTKDDDNTIGINRFKDSAIDTFRKELKHEIDEDVETLDILRELIKRFNELYGAKS